MFKRTISFDKKFFERKPNPNSGKHNPNAGNPPDAGVSSDAGKHHPNTGESHTEAGKPSRNAGAVDADKDSPNADTPTENTMILEDVDAEDRSTEQKPVMKKTISLLSSTGSEKDNDEDAASVSELERSGRRKAKMNNGVSVWCWGTVKVVTG